MAELRTSTSSDNPERSRYEALVGSDVAGFTAYRDVAAPACSPTPRSMTTTRDTASAAHSPVQHWTTCGRRSC